MDFFHYVNIFETKGIEYLLVIAFLLAMLLFAKVVSRRSRVPAPPEERLVPADGRFLAPGHASARLQADGTLAICAGEIPLHLLGKIDTIELPAEAKVERGETIAVLRSGERSLSLPAPTAGTIEGVNGLVKDAPEELETLPESRRWLLRLRPLDLKQALASMHFAADARKFFEDELHRLIDTLEPEITAQPGGAEVMADGGLPIRGLAHQLDAEQWARFERRFFAPQRAEKGKIESRKDASKGEGL